MKRYKFLADIVALLHLGLTVLIVAGLITAVTTSRYRVFALFVSVMLLTSWKIWGDCPCARWENYWRKRYDPRTIYRGSFLEHYSRKYLPFIVRDTFIKMSAFAILVVLIILTVA